MNAQPQELTIVTIAGADYTVENWSGTDVLISKKGTAYMIQPGVSQPHSFPAGTPLRKRGNPVYVLNVGGMIEETKLK
jgi:hypothetical protein